MGPERVGAYFLVATILVACTRSEPAADTTASAGVIAPADSSAGTTMPTGMPSDSMAGRTVAGTIRTASSTRVGTYLTDGNGRALYMFEKDARNASNCSGDCAEEWPPFAADGAANASGTTSGIQSSKLGSITRKDNAKQATYNGMPLYYYHDDTRPGDIEGQGKKEFGGSWYLVSPSGSKIEKGEGSKS